MKNAIITNVTIQAPVDKVWETLYTQFGDIVNFNPNLTGSHQTNGKTGVGCERQCNLDGKTFVRERITHATPRQSLTVDIYDGNMPMVKSMTVEMHLKTVSGNHTEVTVISTVRTKPAFMAVLMKGMMKGKFQDLLIGLKYYLETGQKVSKSTYKPIFRKYKQLQPAEAF